METSISTLQAMAGRFLTADDLFAWEAGSQRRCTDLVRAFQRKDLVPDSLRAAFASERLARPTAAPVTGIAVLTLNGVLTPTPSIFSMLGFGTSVREFTQALFAAALDPKIKAIAVVADSPGGSIRHIPEAAAAMRVARLRKPVVVSVAGMAASAAYWIASNAHVMEATPSASVGNIGVLAERISVARQLAQDGIDVHVISAGKYKAEGHPALPLTEPERQVIQRGVDAAYAAFVKDVALGRGVSPQVVRESYGEGRLVDAPQAVALGMIDRIASVESTLARALNAPGEITGRLTHRTIEARAQLDRLTADGARAELAMHRTRLRGMVERAARR